MKKKKFKIIVKNKVVQADEYEVEATTKEEAINLYINKLAGAIEPINYWMEGEEEFINIEAE